MGFIPEDAEGLCLIVAVDAPDKNLVWVKAPFQDQIKTTKTWGEIILKTSLPESAATGSTLKVYGWNPKKKKAFIDDVVIEFK